MFVFLGKLLRLCRPYRRRLWLGVLMGLLSGLLEPTLLLCVKVAIDVAFPGSSVNTSSFPTYTADSIKDLPAFVARLRTPSDEVSKYLADRISAATRAKLSGYAGGDSDPGLLPEALARELNVALVDPALYEPNRFTTAKLPAAARALLARTRDDAEVARLNRMLIDSAYPEALKPMKPTLTDKYPWLGDLMKAAMRWLPQKSSSPRSLEVTLVILMIPTMMLLRGLVSYLNVYFLQWVAIRATSDLRADLFEHLMNLPLSFLNKISTGELLSRVGADTATLQNTISGSLVVVIKDPAMLIGLIVYLFWQQPLLTLFSLVVFPVCLVPIIVYSRKVRKSSGAVQTQYARLSRIMHESFTGNRIIKAYNLEKSAAAQFREASGRFISHYMRTVRAAELPGPLIEFFGGVGVACLFYYILRVSRQPIDVADFFVFLLAVFSMYRPFKSLSRLYGQMVQANAASERAFELLGTVSTMLEPADPLPIKAAGADIQFDHINFNYDEKPVLRDFNLTVKSGGMVALVGPTGSGKTTVTNLLLRFYDPQEGAVRIGGTDIRQVATRDLRSQIAVVTQETLLFDESIRWNIGLGRPGATEEEMVAAAKRAHAHAFIMEKPQGYDTMIGEKGVTLSGGQKQRLAIARAILKNAPVLVLDEATNSLDTRTEREVQAEFDELMVGRTTICIAHRLSTIQRADVIVVLDRGRIVEMGKHEELLALDGVYRRLYESDLKPGRDGNSE